MKEQPAFPTDSEHQISETAFHHAGMTMRQYYKAALVQGLLAAPISYSIQKAYEVHGEKYSDQISGLASELADAMIAEDTAHAATQRNQE